MANLRERSRENFISEGTIEHINAGSLQRIADATEIMAKNYIQMQTDLDWYKRRYHEENKANKRLLRSQAAYKAHITRLRRQVSAIRNPQSEI